MNCICGCPIPPSNKIMELWFWIRYKEIKNKEFYACKECGRNWRVESYKGNNFAKQIFPDAPFIPMPSLKKANDTSNTWRNVEEARKIIYKTQTEFTKKDGLLDQERLVTNNLVTAWNEFLKLPQTHTSENEDFNRGIHLCQQTILMRILRRDYPDFYPTYEGKIHGK